MYSQQSYANFLEFYLAIKLEFYFVQTNHMVSVFKYLLNEYNAV